MAEYIEREALLLCIDCHGTNKFGMLDEDIRDFVKSQPAADVAPVVHGKWVNPKGGLWDVCQCSECSSWCPTTGISPNYCPVCGAKMDGGMDNATD